MRELVIAADDRTGALEVAGECAAIDGEPVLVVPFGTDVPVASSRVVIDLGSRHVAPAVAAARAGMVAELTADRRALKIDSALRGNWATELAAWMAAAGGGPVVVVAALPAFGRVCRDGLVGVVRDDGAIVPIHELLATDGRGAPTSSRPADHLRAVAAGDVAELASSVALAAWLEGAAPGDVAVCDAATDVDLGAIGDVVRSSNALLAGTAAAIAPWYSDGQANDTTLGTGTVLVVCGSLHPGARVQLDVLGPDRSGLTVLASPGDVARPVPAVAADAMAARLAHDAWTTIERDRPDVVVAVGGDTTAAVLGGRPLIVDGRLGPGTPVLRRIDGGGPRFVTRSGSFGGPTALRDLVVALVD